MNSLFANSLGHSLCECHLRLSFNSSRHAANIPGFFLFSPAACEAHAPPWAMFLLFAIAIRLSIISISRSPVNLSLNRVYSVVPQACLFARQELENRRDFAWSDPPTCP